MHQLEALSPLDGRYRKIVAPVRKVFCEQSLMAYRIRMESEYLIALCDVIGKPLSEDHKSLVCSLGNLSLEDAVKIEEIEEQINHDVKAVEYYMKQKLSGKGLDDKLGFIHFALTSEDTNNLAYGMMIRDCVSDVMLPKLKQLIGRLYELAQRHKLIAMLSRTHGQPASPTTFGKEIYNFYDRLEKFVTDIKNSSLEAKLNGAVGNFNAHYAAYPDIDWVRFSERFIKSFNRWDKLQLVPNMATTQILPYDSYCKLFSLFEMVNSIIKGMDQDKWRYISDDWLKQKPVQSEIGSSTMPYKVNPTNFENSEGMSEVGNGFFKTFIDGLLISRLQRDLSDSCVRRFFGEAFGASLIVYDSALKGLNKIEVDEDKIKAELDAHPEVITEAIQTILRREGIPGAYEKMKDISRGKKITMDDLHRVVDALTVSDAVKADNSAKLYRACG